MPMHDYLDEPRLLADIGGTNARFALELSSGEIRHIQTLATVDFSRFEDAALCYLKQVADQDVGQKTQQTIKHAVIAIANPVGEDAIKMTNHHWAFSVSAARAELGLQTLLMVNDFSALAMAVPGLTPSELQQIGGGTAKRDAVIGILGAGTGLGVGMLVPDPIGWRSLQSEGGHVAFAPTDEREIAVLRYCWEKYEHVSTERLASGPGINLIHAALAAAAGRVVDHTLSTESIVNRALNGDAICLETIDCFCGMLGTFAANLAVTLFTQGGIYIGGGVVPRLGNFFARSSFRSRFEKKGRFSDFTAQIPTYVITAQQPAFIGAAALLRQHLQKKQEIAPKKELTQKDRTYAKLRCLSVEPKTVHLHGEASTTTPASVLRKS
ncbi:glucokinase [Undibacterium sp. Ji22W]|uniref:glucokinase n=1 Tax=Undibacterium sp. Ji22W TaxID=3413038 RepID=UPI003BF13D1D